MRKKEKEIRSRVEIEKILLRAKVCRIAVCGEDGPYIFPVCFGYRKNAIYFHSAFEGKKIRMMRADNRVCFEVEGETHLKKGKTACQWDMHYESVIGSGRAVFLQGMEAKKKGLDVILDQFGAGKRTYSEEELRSVSVIKIEIQRITGKRNQ
ncbi:MAG: pyridoxamine 5'-phosphate oxidase family protein [Candidatus Aminicenantes bacterium]|nr:pyridoxamine 5'-phosphate oxidase family protein [Candidatus Aminicenantes bacterium]